MGFPAHRDFIGRGRYHFEPQTLCETRQVCFPSELNILTKLNIVILSEAKNSATSKTHIQFRSNHLTI